MTDNKNDEAYWASKLIEAIHAPFKHGHEHQHKYVKDRDLAARDIIKKTCATCGYSEPITTITRLIA
jgi:hypothetical protein